MFKLFETTPLKETLRSVWAKINGKEYLRYGNCHQCGKCCTNIAIRGFHGVLKTKEEFELHQLMAKSYTMFDIIEEQSTPEHLVFKCKNLDESTKQCKIYNKRPWICRKYPTEDIFKMGATLANECGYYFKPLKSFQSVMNKIQKVRTQDVL